MKKLILLACFMIFSTAAYGQTVIAANCFNLATKVWFSCYVPVEPAPTVQYSHQPRYEHPRREQPRYEEPRDRRRSSRNDDSEPYIYTQRTQTVVQDLRVNDGWRGNRNFPVSGGVRVVTQTVQITEQGGRRVEGRPGYTHIYVPGQY